MPRHRPFSTPLPTLLGGALALLLVLPVMALLWHGLVGPETVGPETGKSGLLAALSSPVALDALQLSLSTTAITALLTLVLGTPLAWTLARRNFWGKSALEVLLSLPLVLPPVVAGLALLLTFGRMGWLGAGLELAGIQLAFSPAAVVLAQLFVSAPFYVAAARAGFAGVPHETEDAARVDGAGGWQVFRLITLPLALPFLLEGIILAWARALGEFGATLLFAGSLQGETQTIPLAIYAALQSDLAPALALAALMVVVAAAVLLTVRALARVQE